MRDENVLKAKLYHIFVVLIFPSKLKGVLILKQILIDESCSMRNVESWAVRSWYRTQYKRGRIDRIVFPNIKRFGSGSKAAASLVKCAVLFGYSRVMSC